MQCRGGGVRFCSSPDCFCCHHTPMPRITLGTVFKLLILCFIVGLLLTMLNINPQNIIWWLVDAVVSLVEWSISVFGKALTYILIGAVVVIPIWLVLYLWRAINGRR